MPIVDIRKDPKKLTMTVTAQFAAPVARVWAAYADPRQLERFWGPPEWPATVRAPRLHRRRPLRVRDDRPERRDIARLLGVPEHRRAAGV